jgi:hypothetical protein
MPPIYRAPMRARTRDLPSGKGADFGVDHGMIGIGDVLPDPPESLDDAIAAVHETHGARAARMLERFAALPDGTFVWTRTSDGLYRLGRIAGRWRYDDGPSARTTGIHHVRPADWLERPFGDDAVPAAVAATFARGGRNLQRTHGERAERQTTALWEAER